jgi:nucleotide-binding universal stress UspA family protein
MYKKILIPLDGSKQAEDILPIIDLMGSSIKPEVILVYIVSAPSPIIDLYGLGVVDYRYDKLDQYLLEANEYLESVCKKLQSENLKVKILVEIGDVTEVICQLVQNDKVDLVALSEKEKKGISKLFDKSLSSCLKGKIRCPFLIFQQGELIID